MRVLLVAHYFPPDAGPGTPRPLAFARHLPAAGCAVTVLTRTPPTTRDRYEPADPSGTTHLPRDCHVVRAAAAPDLPGCAHALLAAGESACAFARPDVVLVTMSPFWLWRPGAAIARRLGVPLVCDLRDPWAFDGVLDYRHALRWWRERREMQAMLTRADGVVANTPESGRLFRAALGGRGDDRVVVIPNGFDADDFAPPPPHVRPGAELRLVHGGSFLCSELYQHERPVRRLFGWLRHRPEPIDPVGRTPRPLLGALRRLRERGEPAADAIRFVAIGMTDEPLRRCVAESGVADRVELAPYAAHGDLITAIRGADALFLTLHGLPPGHRSRIVPGKTYEYLAAGRPILAALPAGDARELVAQSPRAFVADPCDEAGLAERLVALHAAWRRGEFAASLPYDTFAAYERRAQCRDLAAFLRVVCARGAEVR